MLKCELKLDFKFFSFKLEGDLYFAVNEQMIVYIVKLFILIWIFLFQTNWNS